MHFLRFFAELPKSSTEELNISDLDLLIIGEDSTALLLRFFFIGELFHFDLPKSRVLCTSMIRNTFKVPRAPNTELVVVLTLFVLLSPVPLSSSTLSKALSTEIFLGAASFVPFLLLSFGCSIVLSCLSYVDNIQRRSMWHELVASFNGVYSTFWSDLLWPRAHKCCKISNTTINTSMAWLGNQPS